MDWSRAKSILIVAFLLLDIFLGYQVYDSRTTRWMDADTAQSAQWDLEGYLSRENIQLTAKVPQDTPVRNYLYVEYQVFDSTVARKLSDQEITLDNTVAHSHFIKPVPINHFQSPSEILRQLESKLLHAAKYQQDPYWSLTKQLVYWQMHDQLPLFVAPLYIHVQDRMAKGYSQTYVRIRNQGEGRQVISAYTALRSLVEKGMIKSGEKIEHVALGYYGYKYDADVQVLAPVWRFIHDGSTHYVNGFTGAVERPTDTSRVSGQ